MTGTNLDVLSELYPHDCLRSSIDFTYLGHLTQVPAGQPHLPVPHDDKLLIGRRMFGKPKVTQRDVEEAIKGQRFIDLPPVEDGPAVILGFADMVVINNPAPGSPIPRGSKKSLEMV